MTVELFHPSDREDASAFFDVHGVVAFVDVFSPEEVLELSDAADAAYPDGAESLREGATADNRDMMFRDPRLAALVSDERYWGLAKRLLGLPIEVQHTKYNCKLPINESSTTVDWHQDYPFYPHTNFDMVSGLVHLDREEKNSGGLTFVSGSHRRGPVPHCRDGHFLYQAADDPGADETLLTLTGPPGVVSFHHACTLHSSPPNTSDNRRRLLITQFRAKDAVQLSGVLWKSTGYQVDDEQLADPGTARFVDGTIVENRGVDGRLYDVVGTLQPDKG